MSSVYIESGRLVSRRLAAAALQVPLAEMWRSMGYPPGAEPGEEIRAAALEMRRLAHEIMEPAYQFRLLEVTAIDEDRRSMCLANAVELAGGGLLNSLRAAEKVAPFLVTLGAPIVERVHSMIAEDSLRAYVLDVAASVAAESLAEAVHLVIFREAQKSGLFISHRYSPGYCDWSLTEQVKIFSLLEPERIGVRLTENYMMDPRKSISGVVGLGGDRERLAESPCNVCLRPDCMARRGNFALLGMVN